MDLMRRRDDKLPHKYLNKLGIKSDEACVFNSENEIRFFSGEKGRGEVFAEERMKYGFDQRETWALSFTLATWLYEHLQVYKEIGGQVVDLDFHKFDIPVLYKIPNDCLEMEEGLNVAKQYLYCETEKHTQLEAIDLMIKYLEKYLTGHSRSLAEELIELEYFQGALAIYAKVSPAMWW